jgi:hypothetical protein
MLLIIALSALFGLQSRAAQQCAAALQPDYSQVMALEHSQDTSAFTQLPGFTRSRFEHNWGLVAPESRVWADSPAWPGCKTAHLLSDAQGAEMAMYLVRMQVLRSTRSLSCLVCRST